MIRRLQRKALLAVLTLAFGASAFGGELVRVAIYDHSDGSAGGPKDLQRILTEESGFRCVRVSPQEIRDGALKEADVLIVPGGSGSLQAKKLGGEGRQVVKDFVRNGGGYVGICAGSYLASSHYDWSLGLINAQVFDREHWARGTGDVLLKFTQQGKEAFGKTQERISVYYGQGPLLVPDDATDLPAYEPLAHYATEIAKNGAPTGVMIGTAALARAAYGEGRVLCISCHPEKKGGPHELILIGVGWAAGRELTEIELAPASHEEAKDPATEEAVGATAS
ncbi:MAG TPA: BPL-N domain-containing protein [Pirellulaceae bacterium]|jgi:glutamine amidotransferase-like uncharacterized protein|nr:BPL-N domain-containing protein [Pirellulaceae bacterium]